MKYKIFWYTLIFALGMLVFPDRLSGQNDLQFEVEVVTVEWNNMPPDGNGGREPMFTLAIQPQIYANGGYANLSSASSICVSAGQNLGASGSYNPTSSNSVSWTFLPGFGPDIQPGFDLCGQNFLMKFEPVMWESDNDFVCTFTNGDDDLYTQGSTNWPFGRLTDEPGVWKETTLGSTTAGYHGRITIRFRYTYNALKEVLSYKNTDGDPQPTFCEGDMYRVEAEYIDPQITGGYHIWQKRVGSTWVTMPGETKNYIDVPITNPITHYRVVQTDDPNGSPLLDCLFDLQSFISTESLAITIVPAPPNSSNVNITKTPTCGSLSDMSITYDGISNYPTNIPVKLTLYTIDGATENPIGNAINLNAITPHTFTNLANDHYYLKVTTELSDNNVPFNTIGNCTVIKDLGTLTHYPDPILSAPNRTQPACPGNAGSVGISVTNGNGSFIYELRDNNTTILQSINTPNAGNFTVTQPFATHYYVEARNSFGCSVNSSTFTFMDPQQIAAAVSVSVPIKCKGETGRVLFNNISGGTGPYDIAWRAAGSNSAWTTILTNVNAVPAPVYDFQDGAYEFRLVDAKGCVREIGTATLTEPAVALAISALSTQASACRDDGSITAGSSGGEGPFTFSIPGYAPDPGATNMATFSDLPGNFTYMVSVTDNRGCIKTTPIYVGKDTDLSLSIFEQIDVTCSGDGNGSIEVSASGGSSGYTYSKNGIDFQASPLFENLDGGPITITLEDSRGCTTTIDATIEEPETFNLAALDIVQPIPCPGGMATVIIEFTGRQNLGDNPLMVSTDGGTNFIAINLNLELEPVVRAYVELMLPEGFYDIVLKDKNNCIANGTITFSLTDPTQVTAVLDSTNNISCFGVDDGRIHLDIAGGTPLYTVDLIDANDDSPVQSQSNISAGPFSITSVPPHDNYKVVVTDDNGCMVEITSIAITTPDALQFSLQNTGPDIDCSLTNGEITVSAMGGTPPYQYSLDNSTYGSGAVLSGATTSNTVYVKDANECVMQQTINIPAVPFDPNPMITVINPAIDQCQGATIQVVFTPNGFTHTWKVSAPGADCDVALATKTTGPAESSFEISDLAEGSYQICAVAANCSMAPVPFQIVALDSLKLEITDTTHVLCFGESTGSVSLAVSGGVGPYTITRNSAAPQTGATATYNTLSAGTSFYQVIDSKGCTVGVAQTITQPNLIFYDQLVRQDALCADSTSGSISFRPTGGNGAYSISWRPLGGDYAPIALTGPNVILTGIGLGSYQFLIADDNNCEKEYSFSIGEPTALNLILSDTAHISCNGASDGSVLANGSGGTGDLLYSIDGVGFSTDPAFEGLSPGTQMIYLRDDNACEISREFIIAEPAILEATVDVIDVQCFGANDGRITVNTTGGTLPFRYALGEAAAQTSNVFTGLQPDNYSVIVYDANNCSVAVNGLMITEPDSLTASTMQLTEATCQNGGSAVVTYGGGTGPYTLAWDQNPGINTDTAKNLAGGLHTIAITDAQGCVLEKELEISTLGVPIIDVVLVGSPDCDDDNGVISIQVRGSTLSPFTFTIDGDTVPNGNFANLAAGAYQIAVSDNLGCTSERTVVVSPPEIPTLEVVSTVAEACGQNDGEVTLAPVGGAGPYQLEMSGNAIVGTTLTGLAYGVHSVKILDSKNCTSDFSFNVDSVANPTATIASLGEVCDRGNGQITVAPTSALQPFTFAWSHDTIVTSVAENLRAGAYKVSVTNSRGCVSVLESTVRDIKGPSIQLQELLPSTCGNNNGLIKVSAQNAGAGFNLKWSHTASNSFTQENLAPGTYFLRLTNTNACQDTMSFVVEDQLFPPVEITVEDQSCGGADGSIVVVPDGTGPYEYNWSHDSTLQGGTATNLAEGIYSVFVSDTSGCSIQIDTTIGLNNAFLATVDSVTNSQCGAANGSIVLGVTGDNVGYLWSHDSTLNSPIATNLIAGSYNVEVNNGTSCMIELNAVVTDEGTAALTIVSVDSANCGLLNGGAVLDLSGGAAPVVVSWYHPDDPTAVLQQGDSLYGVFGGIYLVVAEDANGCTNSLQVEIPFAGSLTAGVEMTVPSCPGTADGSATVTVMGDAQNLTYQWNDANAQTTASATDLTAGVYEVIVTSGMDCEVALEVELKDPMAHEVNLEMLSQPSCNGINDGQVGLSVTGGAGNLQYIWNGEAVDPTTQIGDLPAGNYRLSVVDSLGCAIVDSIVLEGPDTLQLSLDFVNGASCTSVDGGNAQVDIRGGTGEYTIQWGDSAMQTTPLALNLAAGLVSVFVTDANQCADSLIIEVPSTSGEMVIERVKVQEPTCRGDADGAIELRIPEGSGSFAYAWNDSLVTNEPLLTFLEAGSYIFHVLDKETGCEGNDTIIIVGPAAWSTALEVTNESCDSTGGDGAITADVTGGNGAYTYQWNDPQSQVTATAAQLQGGKYILTITDAKGCQVLDSAEVKTAGELDIDLGGRQVVLCQGEQHYVELPDSVGITYQWSGPNGFTSNESNLYLPEAGSYWVDVDQAGCRSTDTVTVTSSAESLNALFVLPSQVALGDTVVALEVSWPAPDATDWIFDGQNIQHIPQTNNTHYFVFSSTGTYDISLQSTVGSCVDFITKTVLVANDSASFVFPIDFGTKEILELSLSPNPNKGQFSVSVKLNSVADVFVQINDASGVVEETRREGGANEYQLDFDLNLPPGLHAMTLQAKSSRKTLMFLIN